MDNKTAVEVLKQEIIDWQKARAGYENSVDEEIKEDGHQSLATTADIERATQKISALSHAVKVLEAEEVSEG